MHILLIMRKTAEVFFLNGRKACHWRKANGFGLPKAMTIAKQNFLKCWFLRRTMMFRWCFVRAILLMKRDIVFLIQQFGCPIWLSKRSIMILLWMGNRFSMECTHTKTLYRTQVPWFSGKRISAKSFSLTITKFAVIGCFLLKCRCWAKWRMFPNR